MSKLLATYLVWALVDIRVIYHLLVIGLALVLAVFELVFKLLGAERLSTGLFDCKLLYFFLCYNVVLDHF